MRLNDAQLLEVEYNKGMEVGRRAGIKEVVEWIRTKDHGGGSSIQVAFWDWQAKLKEWG